MKYVECINNSNVRSLTIGNSYLVIEEQPSKYKIMNDEEEVRWYGSKRFILSTNDREASAETDAENCKIIIAYLKKYMEALKIKRISHNGLDITLDSSYKETSTKNEVEEIINNFVSKFIYEENKLVNEKIIFCDFVTGRQGEISLIITESKKVMLFYNYNAFKETRLSCAAIINRNELVNLLLNDEVFSNIMVKYKIISKSDINKIGIAETDF